MRPAVLNLRQRERDLESLEKDPSIDVLVIGGGITGTGVALDAASRGLSVALVERDDLASGTSRWSSKLIHGGLRYLRNGDIAVAWESARERHILMTKTAPHLTRPLPFLVPLVPEISTTYGMLTSAGIRVGDVLRTGSGTRRTLLPPPRRISANEARMFFPALTSTGLRGGILFWDGQAIDDARIVIAVARTAAAYGAKILTRCEAHSIERGVAHCRDRMSDTSFDVHARCVINAAGVWSDELTETVTLRPSKGSHLVINSDALGFPRSALMVPAPGEKARWIGTTPTDDGHCILGVTDLEFDGLPSLHPEISGDERSYLLDIFCSALQRPIPDSAIVGSYSGFRPLLGAKGQSTADISRIHAIVEDADRQMFTIVGGKFTTYRKMAEDVVDAAQRKFGLGSAKSVTEHRALVGAGSPVAIAGIGAPPRLARRFGMEAGRLLDLARQRTELLEPIDGSQGVLPVELEWGVKAEGALSLEDLLDRRVRLDLTPGERDAAVPAATAALSSVPVAR